MRKATGTTRVYLNLTAELARGIIGVTRSLNVQIRPRHPTLQRAGTKALCKSPRDDFFFLFWKFIRNDVETFMTEKPVIVEFVGKRKKKRHEPKNKMPNRKKLMRKGEYEHKICGAVSKETMESNLSMINKL